MILSLPADLSVFEQTSIKWEIVLCSRSKLVDDYSIELKRKKLKCVNSLLVNLPFIFSICHLVSITSENSSFKGESIIFKMV